MFPDGRPRRTATIHRSCVSVIDQQSGLLNALDTKTGELQTLLDTLERDLDDVANDLVKCNPSIFVPCEVK